MLFLRINDRSEDPNIGRWFFFSFFFRKKKSQIVITLKSDFPLFDLWFIFWKFSLLLFRHSSIFYSPTTLLSRFLFMDVWISSWLSNINLQSELDFFQTYCYRELDVLLSGTRRIAIGNWTRLVAIGNWSFSHK